MQTPEDFEVGDKVMILQPDYVAGKVGVVLGREILSTGQSSDRWLIQVDAEAIVLSLTLDEFQVIQSSSN